MHAFLRRRGRRLSASLVACALVAMASMAVFVQSEQRDLSGLRTEANHRLDLFAAAVQGVVASLEHIPATIQLHPAVVGLLLKAADAVGPEDTAAANAYLRKLNSHVGAMDTFTLNNRGVVVASSNAEIADDSLLGTDVSFRPYFLEALSGRVGRHFAIGIGGQLPGYFVSYPIRDAAATVVGVAVIKVSLKPIEQTWDMVGSPVLIADSNNVVISSSVPGWLYTALQPLTVEQRVEHQLTRLYADLPIQYPTGPGGPAAAGQDGRRISLNRPLDGMDWTARIFVDTRGVRQAAVVRAVTAGGMLLLVCLLIAQSLRIARHRKEAQRLLETANIGLEAKVKARTAALTDTNAALLHEVQVRQETESSLRATQSELVQAAKLAVLGQMAASITHELTQPLGALRTFIGNAQEFLRRGEREQVDQNFKIMGRLADQMGTIILPLKAFARKSAPTLEKTDVGRAIANALFLFGSRIRDAGVAVEHDGEIGRFFAWCESNRLEQVLINLLSNSLDATSQAPDPRIAISVTQTSQPSQPLQHDARCICVEVRDNGPGLSDAARRQLFEPFFTTKASGAGLGLGLVISRQIIRDFGGELTLDNRPDGGVVARLTIPAEPTAPAAPAAPVAAVISGSARTS